jgi:hypothetical protein
VEKVFHRRRHFELHIAMHALITECERFVRGDNGATPLSELSVVWEVRLKGYAAASPVERSIEV